jgi:hypothetical protein
MIKKTIEIINLKCDYCGTKIILCPVCGLLFQNNDIIECKEEKHYHKKCLI